MTDEFTFNDLRLNGLVCDGTIRTIDGGNFPIHRAILCVFSPYFRAYFTNSLHNGQPEMKDIYIEDCSAEIISDVLEFAYTKNCNVRTENLEKLLVIADRFSCDALVNFCSDLLSNNLNTENCISRLLFARTFFVTNLEEAASRYLLANMERVANLATLSVDDMEVLLSRDELVVSCEEAVFEAVASWLRTAPAARSQYTARLLRCVRFGLLDPSYFIENVITFEHHTEESTDLLESVARLFSNFENGYYYFSGYFRPRLPDEIVFSLGGWSDGAPTDTIEAYDKQSDSWLLVGHSCLRLRAYHGIAVIDNQIYLVGGFDGIQYYNTVDCFDPTNLTWTEKGCMHTSRCYVSCCVLDGHIYAIGGYTGLYRLNSVERYNPEKNQWTEITSMHRIRSDASATAMAGKIYVAGGFDGEEVMSSVEVYDPTENRWTYIEHMTSPRSGLSINSFNGALYVFGGFDGQQRLTKCEKYSPSTGRWQPLTDMATPRSNMGVVMLEKKFCLIGGFNGMTTVSTTILYDTETNTWTAVGPMTFSRSALSACVIRDLPNTRAFSILGTACYNCGDGDWTKVTLA